MYELRTAQRDALVAGALVALIAALLWLWASPVLIVFGVIAIILGVVVSITVIGLIIGIPLILVGLLGLIAGLIAGTGGVVFALLFGAGVGFVYYRYRMRGLHRGSAAGRLLP
jgi:hypothetical protein